MYKYTNLFGELIQENKKALALKLLKCVIISLQKNKEKKSMKRREFLMTSALTLASTAFLAGCQKEDKKIVKKEGEIAKRKFKDLDIPLLGFGCMRLPMKGEEVDMAELESMVDLRTQ